MSQELGMCGEEGCHACSGSGRWFLCPPQSDLHWLPYDSYNFFCHHCDSFNDHVLGYYDSLKRGPPELKRAKALLDNQQKEYQR